MGINAKYECLTQLPATGVHSDPLLGTLKASDGCCMQLSAGSQQFVLLAERAQ